MRVVYRSIMDRSLTEMAIRGLEVERQRIDDAIRDLRSQIETGPGRQKQQSAQTSKRETATRSQSQSETQRETHSAQTKGQISAAGRQRIAEANGSPQRAGRTACRLTRPIALYLYPIVLEMVLTPFINSGSTPASAVWRLRETKLFNSSTKAVAFGLAASVARALAASETRPARGSA